MVYNYTTMFPFERHFDPEVSTVWMKANWVHSVTLSVLYIFGIFGGERLMSNRPAMNLERLMTFWNAFLAIFSIFGTLRLTPAFFHAIFSDGLLHSMCVMDFSQTVTGFWTQMFGMSKAFELVDTAFIVLRKRPLIFLHWYHHVTVLVYTWHAYKDHTAAGRWFVYMNYLVHACMYTYYALRSAGRRLPKWVAMCLTTMQILQMVAGVFVAGTVYYVKTHNVMPCQQTFESLYFSFIIYTTYFVLFARFFYDAYMKNNNKYRSVAEKDKRQPKKMDQQQQQPPADGASAGRRRVGKTTAAYENGYLQNGEIKKER